jgi:hypothetical protein
VHCLYADLSFEKGPSTACQDVSLVAAEHTRSSLPNRPKASSHPPKLSDDICQRAQSPCRPSAVTCAARYSVLADLIRHCALHTSLTEANQSDSTRCCHDKPGHCSRQCMLQVESHMPAGRATGSGMGPSTEWLTATEPTYTCCFMWCCACGYKDP